MESLVHQSGANQCVCLFIFVSEFQTPNACLQTAAVSSYVTIPPPYTHTYSARGPTGEIHAINLSDGGFAQKIQEFLFVTHEELKEADNTRKALVSLIYVFLSEEEVFKCSLP